MKLTKYITIILFSVVLLSGCNSIKQTLTGAKPKNTNEFFVKKKNPLVLPPYFENLPKPQEAKKNDNINNKTLDLSSVLNKSEDVNQITKKNNSLEKSISKILNSK